MFKFYVVFAGQDMVTDAGWTTPCSAKTQNIMITNKSTKNEGPFEDMGFNGKTVWRFQTKKNKNEILDLSKTPSVTHGP